MATCAKAPPYPAAAAGSGGGGYVLSFLLLSLPSVIAANEAVAKQEQEMEATEAETQRLLQEMERTKALKAEIDAAQAEYDALEVGR